MAGLEGIEKKSYEGELLKKIKDLLPNNYLIEERFNKEDGGIYIPVIRSDNNNTVTGVIIIKSNSSLEKILKGLKETTDKAEFMENLFNATKRKCDTITHESHKSCNALSNLISSEIGHFRMPHKGSSNLALPAGEISILHGSNRHITIDMTNSSLDTLTVYHDGTDLIMKGGTSQGLITNEKHEYINLSSSISVVVEGNVVTTIGENGSIKKYTIVPDGKKYLKIK